MKKFIGLCIILFSLLNCTHLTPKNNKVPTPLEKNVTQLTADEFCSMALDAAYNYEERVFYDHINDTFRLMIKNNECAENNGIKLCVLSEKIGKCGWIRQQIKFKNKKFIWIYQPEIEIDKTTNEYIIIWSIYHVDEIYLGNQI